VPAFAAVVKQANDAFTHLVKRRTTSTHYLLMFAFLLWKLAGVAYERGLEIAYNTFRVFALEPSGDSFRGWMVSTPKAD
jgi:hypothetical protein